MGHPRDPGLELLGWKELGAGGEGWQAGGCTLDLGEPDGLPVVLRGDGQRVEEDEQQHGPVAGIGLHSPPAARPKAPVGSAEAAAVGIGNPPAEITYLSLPWGAQVGEPGGHEGLGGLGGGAHKVMGSSSHTNFPTHQTLVLIILFLEKRGMGGRHRQGLSGSQQRGSGAEVKVGG